jgi:hypothetical protein
MVDIMVRMSLLETTLAAGLKSGITEIEAILPLVRVLDEIMESRPRDTVIQ